MVRQRWEIWKKQNKESPSVSCFLKTERPRIKQHGAMERKHMKEIMIDVCSPDSRQLRQMYFKKYPTKRLIFLSAATFLISYFYPENVWDKLPQKLPLLSLIGGVLIP